MADCLLKQIIQATSMDAPNTVLVNSSWELLALANTDYHKCGVTHRNRYEKSLQRQFDEAFGDVAFFLGRQSQLPEKETDTGNQRLEALLDLLEERIDLFLPHLEQALATGIESAVTTVTFILSSLDRKNQRSSYLERVIDGLLTSKNGELQGYVAGLKQGWHPSIRSNIIKLSLNASPPLKTACYQILDYRNQRT